MKELLRRALGNVKNLGIIGGVLLVMSIVFFVLFYLSVEDKMYDLLGSFLSLDWYWYLGIAILVLIKPLVTLLRKNRNSKKNRKKK